MADFWVGISIRDFEYQAAYWTSVFGNAYVISYFYRLHKGILLGEALSHSISAMFPTAIQ
jgi:hypothetical protein